VGAAARGAATGATAASIGTSAGTVASTGRSIVAASVSSVVVGFSSIVASTELDGTAAIDDGSGDPSRSGASSESDSFAVARSGPIAGSIAANPAVAAIPTAHRARRAG
jgi:hypothetical protein